MLTLSFPARCSAYVKLDSVGYFCRQRNRDNVLYRRALLPPTTVASTAPRADKPGPGLAHNGGEVATSAAATTSKPVSTASTPVKLATDRGKPTISSFLSDQLVVSPPDWETRRWLSRRWNWRKQRKLVASKRVVSGAKRALVTLDAYPRKRLKTSADESASDGSKSVALIQSVWRAWRLRRALLSIKTATILVQATFRGHETRAKISHLHRAASVIQTEWRGFCDYVRYHLFLKNVIIVQRFSRRFLAIRLRAQKTSAIVRLQGAIRSWSAKRLLSRLIDQRDDTIRAEAALRSKSAVCLQSTIRGYMIRKQQRIRTMACVQIQRTVRGFLVQLQFHLRSIDVIIVQSLVRRWLVRRDALRRLDAVLCLQRLARSLHSRRVLKEKRELSRRHCAATLVQKTWRCYNVHVDYRLLILSIIAIQSAVRRCQGCIRHAEARNAALRIQVAVRKWLSARLEDISARKIQAAVRAFLAPLADDDAKDEDDEQEEETTPAPQRPQALRRSPRNHPRSATPADDEGPEAGDEEPAGFTAMDNDAEDEDEDEDEEQEEETTPAPQRRRVPVRAVRRSPRNHPRPATRRSRRIAAQERRYGRPNYKD
jgi:hypothetical protein